MLQPIMAMPMMVGGFTSARAVSFVPEETRSLAPRAAERSCAGSSDRLDLLEQQVDALNLRMKTIQRAVEIQTRILEEMKAEGNFPKKFKDND